MYIKDYLLCKFAIALWCMGLVLLLGACEQYTQKSLTQAQKDSVLLSMLEKYSQVHQAKLKKTEERLSKIRTLLAAQKPQTLDFATKIPVRFPTCSGNFRDSCFFQSPNMALLVSKHQLEQAKTGNDLYELINVDGNGLINAFWAVQDQSYRPIAANFKDTPFASVQKKMNADLYNVQLFFELKYLFVLELASHVPPINEYGGGTLKANYHIFDFQDAVYLGSMQIEAQNTPNFQPPTQTTKEVTKIEERTRFDGKRTITDRYNTKTQEKQATSQATQYYYAKQDLIRNFKKEVQQALNTSFCDEKDKSKNAFLYSVY